jgi:hypothetical protein
MQDREDSLMFKPMIAVALTVPVLAGAAGAANGDPIRLSGAQEDPTVITDGRGTVVLRIQGNTIAYDLRYRDLNGDVTQAHIHIGQNDNIGGIAAFLCSNLNNGPTGTPTCPPDPGHVSGVLNADDVVDTAVLQGVGPGEIGNLIRAIRAGLMYVNVHSSTSPAGEIRGDFPPPSHD